METLEIKKKQSVADKRKFLVGLSKGIQMLVKDGVYDSVNEGLLDFYAEDLPEGTEFKSFKGWKKAGKQVKKGERGYLLWGRPQKLEDKNKEEKEEFEFFPLAYVFSSLQVE